MFFYLENDITKFFLPNGLAFQMKICLEKDLKGY